MKKIKSFTVDHLTLLPGVYVSREDFAVSDNGDISVPVTTYDIRITRPNFEPVMSTGEVHAAEHLGATYLRNRDDWSDRIIYWGPMGCRTGFYLIVSGNYSVKTIVGLMLDTFGYIAGFDGDIPGASPAECGNYSDMDLPQAKKRASAFVKILNDFNGDN